MPRKKHKKYCRARIQLHAANNHEADLCISCGWGKLALHCELTKASKVLNRGKKKLKLKNIFKSDQKHFERPKDVFSRATSLFACIPHFLWNFTHRTPRVAPKFSGVKNKNRPPTKFLKAKEELNSWSVWLALKFIFVVAILAALMQRRTSIILSINPSYYSSFRSFKDAYHIED